MYKYIIIPRHVTFIRSFQKYFYGFSRKFYKYSGIVINKYLREIFKNYIYLNHETFYMPTVSIAKSTCGI